MSARKPYSHPSQEEVHNHKQVNRPFLKLSEQPGQLKDYAVSCGQPRRNDKKVKLINQLYHSRKENITFSQWKQG